MRVGPSTSNPQVLGLQIQPSQEILQKPLVPRVQQPRAILPFTGMTQTYTVLVYSQLIQA